MVHVVFRTDSSSEIGSGHVMRCLTFADMLRNEGAEVSFICRKLPGDFTEAIERKGYPVFFLDEGAMQTIAFLKKTNSDWLVVDHYGIDETWESRMRPYVSKIMVIDDLANRAHDCDVLLDQNHVHGLNERYRGLVPHQCKTFLGARFLLLRPEFSQEDQSFRDGLLRRILISYGGSDPTGETLKVLNMLKKTRLNGLIVNVVAGKANPKRQAILVRCDEIGADCYTHVENMAEMIAEADLAFGAGGITMWERCYLGLPTITTAVADNQLASVQAAADSGAILYAGWHEQVTEERLADLFYQVRHVPGLLKKTSQQARMLTGHDVNGETIHPVVRYVLEGGES